MPAISEHFRQEEFDCRTMGVTHPRHPCPVDGVLLRNLEALRALKGGRALRIVSGYRCPVRNKEVGGARYSQHLPHPATSFGPCWAADIPEGYCTEAEARKCGFMGVGLAGKWAVHVDVRHERATWRYR